jgi:hypothetical protein
MNVFLNYYFCNKYCFENPPVQKYCNSEFRSVKLAHFQVLNIYEHPVRILEVN